MEFVYFVPQEQQPVGGECHAEGATGAGRFSQWGSEPGHPQAHGWLDKGEGGTGTKRVGLEERRRGRRDRLQNRRIFERQEKCENKFPVFWFQSFHSYFSSEHSRLLMLWRQVVGFRRNVCELKTVTERLRWADLYCCGHVDKKLYVNTGALNKNNRSVSQYVWL